MHQMRKKAHILIVAIGIWKVPLRIASAFANLQRAWGANSHLRPTADGPRQRSSAGGGGGFDPHCSPVEIGDFSELRRAEDDGLRITDDVLEGEVRDVPWPLAHREDIYPHNHLLPPTHSLDDGSHEVAEWCAPAVRNEQAGLPRLHAAQLTVAAAGSARRRLDQPLDDLKGLHPSAQLHKLHEPPDLHSSRQLRRVPKLSRRRVLLVERHDRERTGLLGSDTLVGALEGQRRGSAHLAVLCRAADHAVKGHVLFA